MRIKITVDYLLTRYGIRNGQIFDTVEAPGIWKKPDSPFIEYQKGYKLRLFKEEFKTIYEQ